jgi:hypothetical protein
MRHSSRLSVLRWFNLTLVAFLAAVLIRQPAGAGDAALRTLIVGGGPEPQHNQVAIERNVAYVSRLLPAGTPRYTLFADGNSASKTVLYEEEPRTLPAGERAFALVFGSRDDAWPTVQRFRAPALGRLDGPAKRTAVTGGFAWLRKDDPDRVLLYFTGHGSQARNGNLDNSAFDLWGEQLSVRDLAAQIATLPPRTSVTLVMVQCFSGAFGNLIFTGGDPNAGLAEREIAGYFAVPRERMAAGCTPEVNEANYQDFSSYFFAALTGRDRVGRTVRGADYNHDGRVGMDEAYAYSLIHDASVDVPICTSDVLLRWALPVANEEVFQTTYTQAHAWATPAQVAALDALSQALHLSGEARLGEAYRMMIEGARRGAAPGMWEARRQFREARDAVRRSLLARWPDLVAREGSGYAAARAEAIAELGRRAADGRLHDLLAADDAITQAEERQYRGEIDDARVLRFVRLSKSIILAHRLRESGDPTVRDRFERLVTAEGATLLPRVSVAAR